MDSLSEPKLRQRSTPGQHKETATVPVESAEASSILSSSVQGASYLVLLQFVSRMLTFTLNQVLLRFTTAETLGIASVKLELLLNTILFLSREGVRCAAIRVSDDTKDTADNTGAGAGSSGSTDSKDSKRKESKDSAIIRPGTEAYRLQKLVNMVYAPIPVGVIMTCAAVSYYLSQVDDLSEAKSPGYRLSIYLYGLSALIELLAEPMFMVAQYKLWFKTRVSVEGTAVIVRCILTCALTIYGARSSLAHSVTKDTTGSSINTMGVLAFAIAQFAYALLTLGGFLLAFRSKSLEKQEHEKIRMAKALHKKTDDATLQPNANQDVISLRALLPRKLVRAGKDGQQEEFYFDTALSKLSMTLTAQSLLKHVLTEGDKMMLAKFTQDTELGVYAFVINYGSLIARILFQPMEEIARTLFSRLLSDVGQKTSPSSGQDINKGLSETQIGNLVLSRNLLLTIMKFHIFLGLIFIAFGTHYTTTLIEMVVGRYWSRETTVPAVLSLYCYYVPIMGLNGITEAVVQAVASERELKTLSFWMVGFSAVFCATGAFLMGTLDMGASGIVLANCVNLSMRILWSTWFLSGYYGRYIPESGHHSGSTGVQAQTGTDPLSTGSTTGLGGFIKTFKAVPWKTIAPSPAVLAAFGVAFVITSVSNERASMSDGFSSKVLHLGIGVSTFAAAMLVVFIFEKKFIRELQSFVRQRRQ
ncbi:oligosaccharide translocation protein RFT1 [Entomortierella parvispora]|uniref:Man(5)GlcNAc(2)-PP-dolichol translocation protein RFT1 n=1 Tax=Entomortierella parvispora TaxID=205924 RepID=A0A9P3HN21_9FUNG|nr:oligosaccharide translocation protein RFT1 [Entomortierella parvispora]